MLLFTSGSNILPEGIGHILTVSLHVCCDKMNGIVAMLENEVMMVKIVTARSSQAQIRTPPGVTAHPKGAQTASSRSTDRQSQGLCGAYSVAPAGSLGGANCAA